MLIGSVFTILNTFLLAFLIGAVLSLLRGSQLPDQNYREIPRDDLPVCKDLKVIFCYNGFGKAAGSCLEKH